MAASLSNHLVRGAEYEHRTDRAVSKIGWAETYDVRNGSGGIVVAISEMTAFGSLSCLGAHKMRKSAQPLMTLAA